MGRLDFVKMSKQRPWRAAVRKISKALGPFPCCSRCTLAPAPVNPISGVLITVWSSQQRAAHRTLGLEAPHPR